ALRLQSRAPRRRVCRFVAVPSLAADRFDERATGASCNGSEECPRDRCPRWIPQRRRRSRRETLDRLNERLCCADVEAVRPHEPFHKSAIPMLRRTGGKRRRELL